MSYTKEGILLYQEKGKAYAFFDKNDVTDTQVIDYLVLNLNRDNWLYSNEILVADKELEASSNKEKPYILINNSNSFVLKHTFEPNSIGTNVFKHYKVTQLNYGLNAIKVMSGERKKICYAGLLIANPKNLGKTINIGMFKDDHGNYHNNFDNFNVFDNYAEDETVFKLTLDTNTREEIFISILDTIGTTIFLKATNKSFELWKAQRKSFNELTDDMKNWTKVASSYLGEDSVQKLKAVK